MHTLPQITQTIQTGPNHFTATKYDLPLPYHYDSNLFATLIETVETTISSAGGRVNLSKWIATNTRDPLNPNKPWSFHNHEFQIAIADSVSPRTVVMKASQLGVSELLVRITLALLAKLQGRHAMYTLPDANFAKKFAPTRFDPVIEASPRLRALVTSDSPNSNSVKRIGSSYLYISGAQSERQSISVPASILVHDEVAYSNQEVLGTYSSRLGHLEEGQEIVYSFSTPLLPNHSIHKLFLQGTQEQYAIYHRACSTWVILDPIQSIRIPHLDLPLELLTKTDVNENLQHIENAYIECPHCKRPISQENLQDPQTRAWVPTNPSAPFKSFDANFLVLPAIKTPSKVLKDRLNYGSTEKWLNFAIGRPADRSDSRITETAITKAFSLTPNDYPAQPSYTVLGMDVGKTCHLSVIAPASHDTLLVIHTELIKQDENNNSANTFVKLYKQYRAIQGVIDAGPEFTVTTQAQAQLPYNQVWGCYFTRGRGKTNLEFFETREQDGTVIAQRTRALDEFVADFNHGRILFRRDDPNSLLLKAHLRAPARITDKDPAGEDVSRWVSSSDDHFFFSVFYAWLAYRMVSDRNISFSVPTLEQRILFGRTRMKS